MLRTLFGKKKLTEDKTANIFVNTIISVVDNTFEEVRDSIINDQIGYEILGSEDKKKEE